MSEAAVAPAGDQQAAAGGAAPQAGTWGMLKGFAIRMLVIYLVTSFFRRGSTPAGGAQPGGVPAVKDAAAYKATRNMFESQSLMDVYFYVNGTPSFRFEGDTNADEHLFWRVEDFRYGNWDLGEVTTEKELQLTEAQMNNGTVYLHVFVAKAGWPVDPRESKYEARNCFARSFRLNKYKKRVYKEMRNLLTGETTSEKPTSEKAMNLSYEVLSFWHPNVTVNLVDDQTAWQRGSVPAMFTEYIRFDPSGTVYQPIVYFNDYWNLNTDYLPLNDTTPTVTLRLTLGHMSMFKWQLYIGQTQRSSWYQSMFSNEYVGDMSEIFDESDEEQDALKRTLLETNFYLLVVTVLVSLLHTVFEFLAFKNDIQFWRSRENLEGLSVRTVLFNVLCSLIVVLYVFDNEANFLVKLSVVVSLLIDIWKIKKVVNVQPHTYVLFGSFRVKFLRLVDKSSYVNSGTKQYDELAFRYLSWALFPMIFAYAGYSLMYQEHKSWFSWVVSMLYGFLLTFGFIMMTPQLFINYKLKSVAHLPWRMLTYKFLNTFIDDLFAFVIHMPTLYRLGCLRDDVIFFIYLYQRWMYPVDRQRANEFGVTGEELAGNSPLALQGGESASGVSTTQQDNTNGHVKNE